MEHTEFLIVGAGPYSLATAAYAKYLGADVTVVGKPLDFWKTNMPRGMFLRSNTRWHLDARGMATFEAYVKLRGLTEAQIKPMPLDTFLDYASWFMGQYDVTPHPALVTKLEKANGAYRAQLEDGSEIQAEKVLLGLGFAFFKHVPTELVEKLPPGSYTHTCDAVDLEYFRNKRVLIVGGRQSAFEWAALICEKGADSVHLTFRHETPKFTEPNWEWVKPMVSQTLSDHSWWRRMTPDEQENIRHRFWAAGRLQLEEWLDARVHRPNIFIHSKTNIVSVTPKAQETRGEKTYDVTLDDGSTFNVHHIILATGYRPNMHKVAFLDGATILQKLAIVDGFPVLDAEFQTNLPNLYITGFAATRDFGPFFGFTVGCPVAAQIVGEAVADK
ncbi:MAG TPA: NAD(P)-binding domain-containing protein [Anaerolineae bacterium]|nr:NAD(P)-binding domain-containing protein [Anaerolineae bacterium]